MLSVVVNALAFAPAVAAAPVCSRTSAVSMMAGKKYKLPGMGAGTPAKSATRSLYGYTVSTYRDGFENRAMPSFDPEEKVGAQAPLGFWDPLKLTDPFDEEEFDRRRAVEIKHGRVAMLACLGYIVPYISKLPGALTLDGSVTFADVPVGIAALKEVPAFGLAQILLLAGLLEVGPFKADQESPGDLGFDPLKLQAGLLPSEFAQKQAAELANGRLAMIGSLGFLVGDVLNAGNPYIGSPFAAFL